MLRLTNSSSRLINHPLPSDDPRQRQPDIALAKKVLDWSPGIQLEEGLKRTIAYFRDVCRVQETAGAQPMIAAQ